MINIKCKKKLNYLKEQYAKILEETIKVFKITDEIEVNVELVSSFKIKRINSKFRNINKVTDVLSFPTLELKMPLKINLTKEKCLMDINPETDNIMLGDIYICFKKVKEQAKEYGHSINRESAYLFLHGILHLLGFDHMIETDKAEMRKYEEKILKNLDIQRN